MEIPLDGKGLKDKNLNLVLRPFYSVLLFTFSFIILSFIIMRTKKMYGIKNESNGIGLVRMYLTTCFKPGFHIVVSVLSVVSVVRKNS